MSDRPSPFDGLGNLFERLRRHLGTTAKSWESEFDAGSQLDLSTGGSATRLDLTDHGDTFVVTVDVPGFDSDDLESRLQGDTLEISGEREGAFEADTVTAATDAATDAGDGSESAGTYIRHERQTQSFSRQVKLPDPVDADAVTASLNNGILTIWLPKYGSSGETYAIDLE
ncbi:Hsp20/alpha crystallin family protein [Natronorubrum texcoconense]|uniref:HSP20 family protein n=1 Tax=Natronorubrum texcoconense TaxID=1095776 RepID=A0A1G9E0U3_9EURY|nr:Hsp20/alpha crystallin family protein [Natronorubrum texcoconense]SDK69708.1 HSP20 family protein [Natronorubrum texcoconense]